MSDNLPQTKKPKKSAAPRTRAKKAKVVPTRQEQIALVEAMIKEVEKERDALLSEKARVALVPDLKVVPEILDGTLIDIEDELKDHQGHRAFLLNPENEIH